MKSGIIYLACPYTDDSLLVRNLRWMQSADAAAWLITDGKVVFSPITQSHPVSLAGQLDSIDHQLWNWQNEPFMDICDELYVLAIDGWKKSKGVTAEIIYFRAVGKPVHMLRPVIHREFHMWKQTGYVVVPYGQRGRTPGMKMKNAVGRPKKSKVIPMVIPVVPDLTMREMRAICGSDNHIKSAMAGRGHVDEVEVVDTSYAAREGALCAKSLDFMK